VARDPAAAGNCRHPTGAGQAWIFSPMLFRREIAIRIQHVSEFLF